MSVVVSVGEGVRSVDAREWDALVGSDNPFIEHAFLATLEESGAVGPGTGWLAKPVLAREGGRLVGAAPAYLRGNSYGEYIFDWAWAQGARRAGIQYYPKVTVAVPFTPATGARLLGESAVHPTLISGVVELAKVTGSSSVHFLFVPEAQAHTLAGLGLSPRRTYQFHWTNPGWHSFDDYLGAMTHKRRKEVRRERRLAREDGVEIRVVRGEDLTSAEWRSLHSFYASTIAKMGAHPYLVDRFWALAPSRLAQRVVAVLATRHGECVAGAFNLRKGPHLYGRYWGCLEEHRALHFEVCYYALIEWCLDNGITRFEAGAQGEHKLSRGFLPSVTHSAHLAFHPGLNEAISRFCHDEGAATDAEVGALSAESPFRGGG